MSFRDYVDKLKRYFPFNKEEHGGFWVGVLVLSFIASFTKWGVERFDFSYGLMNWLLFIIVAGVVIFIHHAGQRMMALEVGFRAEQKIWWSGLFIGLVLAFVTNGHIRFLACSGTIIHLLAAHRLGRFRYGPGVSTIAQVAIAGPIANVIFAGIIKALELWYVIPTTIAQPFVSFSIAFAGWNMLPIPPLDGSKVFYWSRLAYVFFFSAIASYAIMAYFFNYYSLLWAVIIGALCWLVFLIFFERVWST